MLYPVSFYKTLTAIPAHQFHNTNAIFTTFSLNMCCIYSTLSLLNSCVKAEGPINNLLSKRQHKTALQVNDANGF